MLIIESKTILYLLDSGTQLLFPYFQVDDEGTLWLLADKLPRFLYKELDPNEINYSIYSISTTDAIAGTACQL